MFRRIKLLPFLPKTSRKISSSKKLQSEKKYIKWNKKKGKCILRLLCALSIFFSVFFFYVNESANGLPMAFWVLRGKNDYSFSWRKKETDAKQGYYLKKPGAKIFQKATELQSYLSRLSDNRLRDDENFQGFRNCRLAK